MNDANGIEREGEKKPQVEKPQTGKPQGSKPQTEKPQGDNIARVTRMGTASIPLLLLEFAVPTIAGMLVNAAYNVIDSVFLGQAMGEVGLATATVAMPVMTIFMALSMLVGNGGNALAALRMGEGRRDEAEWTLGNTVFLALALAVIVFAISMSPLIEPLLLVSGATAEDWDYARTFIRILSAGFVFQVIGMGVNNFIRTAGAPNRALVTMVIGAVACTVFNYLFVMVFGWGVAGSAWATLCGQACSCISVLWYFVLTPNVPMKLRARYLKPRRDLAALIVSLGMASFIMQIGMALVNFVLNNLLNYYGTISPVGAEGALASIGIVQRIAMFVVMPLIGVAVAAQPLLGFCYGAHNFQRVRKTYWWAVAGSTMLAVTGWLVIHLFAVPIVGFFGITDPELRDFTVFALGVQLMMLPLVGFQIVSSNYFQATGQPAKSIFLSLTRQILFLIPLYVVLPMVLPGWFPQFTGLDALYFSVPVSDFLSVFTAVLFIVIELRRLGKLESGQLTAQF
ncbi:MATE family efflux transporter [Adlercreutzia sp. ZJ138]|uniref:MATE family efflux transporter n=1 Tax=Adlercreutzia sp. ZJ138 TaxID=2709405 RepID=UPI001F14F29E|nr:MATE family efflux transporter [Adlercreutzia sp. ZJ138]